MFSGENFYERMTLVTNIARKLALYRPSPSSVHISTSVFPFYTWLIHHVFWLLKVISDNGWKTFEPTNINCHRIIFMLWNEYRE